MAYATLVDLLARFGQTELLRLTAPEGQEPDTIDEVRVQAALDDASAVIDAYAARRYATPLSPVPQIVTRLCCALARFELAQAGGVTASDAVVAAQKAAVQFLERVRDGVALFPDAQPAGQQGFAAMQDRGDPVYYDDSVQPAGVNVTVPGFWTESP